MISCELCDCRIDSGTVCSCCEHITMDYGVQCADQEFCNDVSDDIRQDSIHRLEVEINAVENAMDAEFVSRDRMKALKHRLGWLQQELQSWL